MFQLFLRSRRILPTIVCVSSVLILMSGDSFADNSPTRQLSRIPESGEPHEPEVSSGNAAFNIADRLNDSSRMIVLSPLESLRSIQSPVGTLSPPSNSTQVQGEPRDPELIPPIRRAHQHGCAEPHDPDFALPVRAHDATSGGEPEFPDDVVQSIDIHAGVNSAISLAFVTWCARLFVLVP